MRYEAASFKENRIMKKSSTHHNAKRLARLAAVQGLYQIELTGRKPSEIIGEFARNPSVLLGDEGEEVRSAQVDQDLFRAVVGGVTADTTALDDLLKGAFSASISSDRVEVLLRAILRAGAYELHQQPKIPAGVIINDYVDVAHAFFDSREPGLVNGVLDRLGKTLRG